MKNKISGKYYLSLASLCMMIVIVFTACSTSKESITASDFESKASARSLVVKNTISSYEGMDHILSSTSAFKLTEAEDEILWSMDFLVANSSENAARMYQTNVNTFENESDSGIHSSIKAGNYGTYEKISGGKYMYVAYVDSTMIYVNADEQYKDEIKALIEDIGY